MNRYSPKDTQELAGSIARASGVPEEGAAILAASLVDADIHFPEKRGKNEIPYGCTSSTAY